MTGNERTEDATDISEFKFLTEKQFASFEQSTQLNVQLYIYSEAM